jgi:hypothetical protein
MLLRYFQNKVQGNTKFQEQEAINLHLIPLKYISFLFQHKIFRLHDALFVTFFPWFSNNNGAMFNRSFSVPCKTIQIPTHKSHDAEDSQQHK